MSFPKIFLVDFRFLIWKQALHKLTLCECLPLIPLAREERAACCMNGIRKPHLHLCTWGVIDPFFFFFFALTESILTLECCFLYAKVSCAKVFWDKWGSVWGKGRFRVKFKDYNENIKEERITDLNRNSSNANKLTHTSLKTLSSISHFFSIRTLPKKCPSYGHIQSWLPWSLWSLRHPTQARKSLLLSSMSQSLAN